MVRGEQRTTTLDGRDGSEGFAYPCSDVSLGINTNTAELDNDGNEIEQSGNGSIEQLLKEK